VVARSTLVADNGFAAMPRKLCKFAAPRPRLNWPSRPVAPRPSFRFPHRTTAPLRR